MVGPLSRIRGIARLPPIGTSPHADRMSISDATPIISHAGSDGTLAETIFDMKAGTTLLAVAHPDGTNEIVSVLELPDGTRLVPYSATNNLLATRCVLLPSALGDVGDAGDMVGEISSFLARYVDLSPAFAELAPYYVLLTWVYDAFGEVPMLRFRGDFGSGKTRALLALGSLCYKPFFASGASTVSPIFHILDVFRGTMVLDEADFRYSDMTGELTKILNNGTVDGLPVLRTMTNRHKELNPQAFRVFGPKIIAMREHFDDRALESRLITEEMARRPLPPRIPIHTPPELAEEATQLRNRLLTWRFRNRDKVAPIPSRAIGGASARMNQMALPLLSLVNDDDTRARIAAFLLDQEGKIEGECTETPEMRVLAAIVEAFEEATAPVVRVADVAERFNAHPSRRLHIPLSNKAVGVIIREKLRISTAKSHGTYGITQDMRARVYALADRHGVPHTMPSFPHDPARGSESHASREAS